MSKRNPIKTPAMRAARTAAELTQAQLAVAADCGLSTVQRHEKAGTWPRRPSTRRRLMAALGVTL